MVEKMSKWKCEICGSEFDNYHAQGFNNKIHCPLCFFKQETINLKQSLKEIKKIINDCKQLMPHEFDWEEQADNILEIIEKLNL